MFCFRSCLSIAVAVGTCLPAFSGAAEFDCVVQPRQVIEVRSPIEGLLERIMVDRGATVSKGQTLAYVDSSVERALAEGAKYRSEMDGASKAGQGRVELSTRKLNRAQELVRQQFLSQQAQDDALSERQIADAELQEAKDNRRLAQLEHQRLLKLIQLKTVRSPINGVVMERVLNVGELAEAGVGRRPILRLAEIDTLYVEALLPAMAYGQIKVGLVGEVTPTTSDNRIERATVKVVDRVLDAGSGTFGVRLELPNHDARLLAGVRCKVNFPAVNLSAGLTKQRPIETVASASTAAPPTTPPAKAAPAVAGSSACQQVIPAVNTWAQAWGQQDLAVYFAGYSDKFVPPNGVAKSTWAAQRTQRISQQGASTVTLKDLRTLTCDAGQATVAFTQAFRSISYSDTVQKTLALEWGDNTWRITREAAAPPATP